MTPIRILVTGAEGQLARSLAERTDTLPADWEFATKHDLDITSREAVDAWLNAKRFDVCINTAAYTRVDMAETEPEEAKLVNTIAPEVLAQACAGQGITLFQFSTDYVYDNALTRPLKEEDPVSPKSIYARTKLEGEQRALAANTKTVVIRTSWVFSEYGHNFVKTMVRLMKQDKPLDIVDDQLGCPTYAGDLAAAVIKIISAMPDVSDPYGIYNFCNEGAVTWFGFAGEIAGMLKRNADIRAVSTAEYGAGAPRPRYSVLDTTKIRNTFSVLTPHWREGLRRVIDHLDPSET